MSNSLPKDLYDAENMLYDSLIYYLKNSDLNSNLLSINLKFDGLRINPIINRLSDKLKNDNFDTILLWADAGGAALARRDMPNHTNDIYSFSEYQSKVNTNNNSIIIASSPQPYDFREFESLCSKTDSVVIMLNGKLEDLAVGIGSVGRERRERFINSWNRIFWLEPISGGAIMRVYPHKWMLFKCDDRGYSFIKSFEKRPDQETIISNIF